MLVLFTKPTCVPIQSSIFSKLPVHAKTRRTRSSPRGATGEKGRLRIGALDLQCWLLAAGLGEEKDLL